MSATALDTTSVFVALGRDRLAELVTAGTLAGPIDAYGVTDALVAWGGFADDQAEDALFAAQTVAGLAALTLPAGPDEPRIVVAVPAAGFVADDRDAPDAALGHGRLPELRWTSVEAVFADDPDDDPTALGRARERAAGRAVSEAWDDAELAGFVDDTDLGWFTPAEAARWVAPTAG